MGISTLTTSTPKIVLSNVQANTSASAGAQWSMNKNTIVPKGVYTVTLIPHSQIYGGASASPGYSAITDYASIIAFDAATGRPSTFYVGSSPTATYPRPTAQKLYILKDSYLSVKITPTLDSGANSLWYDVVLEPSTSTPFKAELAFTPNTQTTATTTGTSTNVNVAVLALCHDYDSDTFAVIASNVNGTGSTTRSAVRIASGFSIWRKNTTTGAWYKRSFSIDVASGYAWYNANGLVVDNSRNTGAGFFIKNNILHNLAGEGVLIDSAATTRYGWIKGDISGADGSTVTFSPGHTNSAFSHGNGSIGIGASNIMIYWHDTVNKKVIYNGAQSGTYNGTWGTYGWLHNWAQWDIATNTVDYSNVNGTIDPRLAGSATYVGHLYAIPNATTGNSYCVSPNGTSGYLTTFDRSGNKTGVGNFTAYYGGQTSATTGIQPNTTNNVGLFLSNGDFLMGGNFMSSDWSGNRTAIFDPISVLQILFPRTSGISVHQGTTVGLVSPTKVYFMDASYNRLPQVDGTFHMTVQAQVVSAPISTSTLGLLVGKNGGAPSSSDTSLSGVNPNGTW